MRLDGALRCSQLIGDLFVELAPDHQGKDFGLPRRQRVDMRAQRGEMRMLLARPLPTCQGALNHFEQGLPGDWLRQKVLSAPLDGADAYGNVAMTGEEDDRQQDAALVKFGLQLEAAQALHSDIEQDAAWI